MISEIGAEQVRPKISVVIPLFNKASTIGETIESVCLQTCRNIEILVVDDGSTDGGLQVVKKNPDNRIRIISQVNQGQSAARNRGLESALGSYIAFIDGDDRWDKTHLESMLKLSESFPNAGIYATAYRTNFGGGRVIETKVSKKKGSSKPFLLPDYFRLASLAPVIWVGAAMVPKTVFDEIGGFLAGEHRGADREMWARIACNYDIAYAPTVSVTYDCGALGRESNKVRELQWPPLLNFLDENIKNTPMNSRAKGLRRYRNAVLYGFIAKAVVAGDRSTAVAAWRYTNIVNFSSMLRTAWMFFIILLPNGVGKILFRILGSRIFFPIKRLWLLTNGINLDSGPK